jgi:hypothetical protein
MAILMAEQRIRSDDFAAMPPCPQPMTLLFNWLIWYESRKSFEPQAGPFGPRVSKVKRLDDLVWFSDLRVYSAGRVLDSDTRNVSIHQRTDKIQRFLLASVRLLLFPVNCACYRQMSARRESNHQIPSAIEQRQYITLYMPRRISSCRKNVSTPGVMPPAPEFVTDPHQGVTTHIYGPARSRTSTSETLQLLIR